MPKSLRIAVAFLCCCLLAAQQAPVGSASPVDLRIAAAQKQVKSNPSPATFNDLAFAFLRRGRDSRDETSYLEAGKALSESLRLSGDNYDAQKLRVAVLLGLNDPVEALKLAAELNHKVPDDIAGWASLVDTNVAIGNYGEAERDAQWVLDLRPGSSLGFEKAASLRELFGDSEGAIEFFDEANRRTSQNDVDQKSWLLTRKAQLLLRSGNSDAASRILAEALRLFPDSQLAIASLAQVRLAEGNNPAAVTLLETCYRRVPSAVNLYALAEALSRSGQAQEAASRFALFEKQARSELSKHRDAGLLLISYYLDTKPKFAEALALAQRGAAERHDADTLATYAWALYRNDRFSEAKAQMEKALAVGIRDPVYFCHAASISKMAKDSAATARYLKELSSMPKGACPATAPLRTVSEMRP